METGEQFGRTEVRFSLGVIQTCISGQEALADPALLHLIVDCRGCVLAARNA